ncbi:MAG: cyclic nucleotide-binding domain-containing protein, partial [Ilumatobacteraceae bacterium]
GSVSFGPTPVAVLISCLVVAVVLMVVLLLASQVGSKLVDKRWPANQPLTPSEVLWGESGGHVKKSFPGLDPRMARDLAQYISTKKVPAGTVLVEAGDLPHQFILLKSGSAEVLGTGGTVTLKPGDSVGGENIIGRRAHASTVRATAPSEIVSIGAEDYLAATALGMSDDDDQYVIKALGSYFEEDSAGRR